MKAAVEHLTGEAVKLVVYGDNSSSLAFKAFERKVAVARARPGPQKA